MVGCMWLPAVGWADSVKVVIGDICDKDQLGQLPFTTIHERFGGANDGFGYLTFGSGGNI